MHAKRLIWLAILPTALGWAAPCPDRSTLRQPFFGDLHVHTRYSLDASTQGTLTSPDQAYAFARGATLPVQPWQDGRAMRSLKLERPLDFAMVSDHAELFGETAICADPEHPEYDAWQCMLYRDWPRAAYYWFNYWSAQHAERVGFCGDGGETCLQQATTPWLDIQRAAAAHDEACEFTTFVGYEWTGGSVGDASGNIHRNVVFSGADVPDIPASFIDEPSAEGLFRSLDRHCDGRPGCDALVIPHNSNLSAGLMFRDPDDAAAAAMRHRYERLAEIMQHKGSSECYFDPLGSADELCAFEQLPVRSFTDSGPAQPGDGFLRDVLKRGLVLQERMSANPYQFGLVGSSDTHLGAPGAVEEDTFLGHGGAGVPAAEAVPPGLPDHLEYNPGGLAVLWAEENTRESLFSAMKRREAYATSGPRIVARFFAGWEFEESICHSDVAGSGYAGGVPMGGTLGAPEATAPIFVVQAQQDPLSSGLERLQIVKGWTDADGNAHETVHDVARSETSASVDVDTCAVTDRGAAQLCTTWRDPDFDADEPAVYYARVLEDPSCRWSQRQCVAAGVDCADPATVTEGFEGCCSVSHRPLIRERAWTSPIWFTPASERSPARR